MAAEKMTERKLVQAVHLMGGLALKFVSPGFDGVPDRVVLLPGGKAAFVELKAPGKKMRPLQVRESSMVIEKKRTADLIPADYNPRKDLKPGDAEYEKLKRSIEQFGYVEPVIWNKTTGFVVGGHQRLKVLLDMGITEVECVVVEMDAEEEKALNIALNKISGEWESEYVTTERENTPPDTQKRRSAQ